MFKKMLVPLDGSSNSERILPWVAGLAQPLGASVELLAVIEPENLALPGGMPEPPRRGSDFGPHDAPSYDSEATRSASTAGFGVVGEGIGHGGEPDRPPAYGTQIVDQAISRARAYLTGHAHELEDDYDLAATIRVAVGRPAEEIISGAVAGDVELIALATRRESALSRGILGSVTDRVLRTSNVPVLVVHPRGPSGFPPNGGGPREVIIPLDGSELGQRAVEPGLAIAEAAGASVRFIRVVNYTYFPVSELAVGPYSHGDAIGELRILAREYLKPFLTQAEARGLDRSSHVEVGFAPSVITEEAERRPGALIVMSTHGRSGVQRLLLGSVVDKVIRTSGSPILVIPPSKDQG